MVVGTHFFSPVPMMRLCELVRGYKTSDEALTRARTFAEVVGKTCIVVNRDVAGFVNYGAEYTLDAGVAPFARLTSGITDGLVAGDLVATNLHGPVLPMNPAWADLLLDRAASLAGDTPSEPDAHRADVDDYARRSRAAIRARIGA